MFMNLLSIKEGQKNMKGNSFQFSGYNKAGSTSVGIVKHQTVIEIDNKHKKVPDTGIPNSVTIIKKNGITETERYYDDNGNPELDIDYTNHGNSKTHPVVPHEHPWIRNPDGTYKRDSWRNIR